MCGVCSTECTADSDCSGAPGPARCIATNGYELSNQCDQDASAAGICLPTCDTATPCAGGQQCVNGGCIPTPATSSVTGDAANTTLALGGTIGGTAFSARDAIVAETVNWKSGFYPGTSTVLLVSDWPNLCSTIEAANTPFSTHLVLFDITQVVAGQAQPISSPGDYTWVSDPADLSHATEFTAYYSAVDSQCALSKGFAAAGTLTLSSAIPTAPAGNVSVTFTDGSSLSGNFAVSQSCATAAVDTYLNRNPTCN
jgi:hypothetical protein